MKPMPQNTSKSLIVFLTLLFSVGCSASLTRFEPLINQGQYKKAADLAAPDPESTRELATSLIVQAIKNGKNISANIDILNSSAGRLGKRTLKALCRRGSSPASDHACIARSCRRLPRKSTLRSYLTSDFGDVRARAARKWADKLDQATLISLLGDIEPGTRRAAVQALGRGFPNDKGVASALQNTLRRDPVATVRSAAAKTGPALGEEALLALKAALRDENLGVRLAVIEGLAALGQPAATDILRNIAFGPLDEMGVVAIAELLRQGEDAMDTRLEAATQSPRLVIRKTALLRLERSGTENRRKYLEKALEDRSQTVVLLAARLLTKIKNGKPLAQKALQKIMNSDSLEAPSARNLLATLGDEKAAQITRKRLQTGGEAEIVSILTEAYRSSKLSAGFAPLLGHKKEIVRLAAARACLLSSRSE